MPSSDFAMLGVAGFVAPRHLKAIHDTENRLVAACDRSDSVGIMDRYFPEARFFTEVERFDRHLEKRNIDGSPVEYISICTPNYLHDAHVRLALRVGAHAICEKPLVLSPWNLDQLAALEERHGRRVYTVLQLRLLPQLIALRERVEAAKADSPLYEVSLKYITPRGRWYGASWKGDERLSGGLVTNIGIHLFDMLVWVFGSPYGAWVQEREPDRVVGKLKLRWANVHWELSTRREDLPPGVEGSFRSMWVDGEEVDFSTGFTDLHTRVYEEILAGRGAGIEEARPAIELVHGLREK